MFFFIMCYKLFNYLRKKVSAITVWFTREQVSHPKIHVIFIMLYKHIKMFYLKKDKSFKDLSFLYLKIIVVLEYIQFYCLSYTKTGRTVLILCGILLIDCHSKDPIIIISSAFWLLSYFVGLSISFYILMQFSINRQILIDILGSATFEYYVSSNPASNAVKNASTLMVTVFGIGTSAAFANMHINTKAIENKVNILVKASQELDLPVKTEHITTILNSPDLNSSIFGKVFGGPGGTLDHISSSVELGNQMNMLSNFAKHITDFS